MVLPQSLSREYGIEYGDYVFILGQKDGILIQKAVRVGDEIRVAPVGHDKRAVNRYSDVGIPRKIR